MQANTPHNRRTFLKNMFTSALAVSMGSSVTRRALAGPPAAPGNLRLTTDPGARLISFQPGWRGRGTFVHGQTVTIIRDSGGLGAGPQAVLYEDFEEGVVGERVGGIFSEHSPYAGPVGAFTYSSDLVRTGTKSGRSWRPPEEGYNPNIRGFFPSPTNAAYISVWVNYQKDPGESALKTINNNKMIVLSANPSPFGDWIHCSPSMIAGFMSKRENGEEVMSYFSCGQELAGDPYKTRSYAEYPPAPTQIGQWLRFSLYLRCSTRNIPDGARYAWMNGRMSGHFYDPYAVDPVDDDQNAVATVVTGTDYSSIGSFGLNNYLRFWNDNLRTSVAQGASATTITLDADAPATDHYYSNVLIDIISGTGAGQQRAIDDYIGSTRVALLRTPWDVIPDATSGFKITGYDGADYKVFWDDVYIGYGNDAFARVEISDSDASWDSTGTPTWVHSEIQNSIVSWTGDRITFTINRKGHASLTGKHLWVIAETPVTALYVGQFL